MQPQQQNTSVQLSRELFRQPDETRQSPLSACISLVAHIAVLSLLATVGFKSAFRSGNPDHPLVFIDAFVQPLENLPAIEPLREVPKAAKLPPLPEPAPEPPAEKPKPAEPEPEPPPPPKPEPPPPSPPKPPLVRVGDFAAAEVVNKPQPLKQLQVVGFEGEQAIAPEVTKNLGVVGAFDARNESAAPRPGTDRPAVMAGGFGQTQTIGGGVRSTRSVASSGFGAGPAAAPTQAMPKPDVVKSGGFGDAPQAAVAAAAMKARTNEAVTPVEVISKPVPGYSDEARAMKIEGEVVLEVEFSAAGTVRVLRVVRSLGHGLDELAARAAERITFKPARAGGQAVDFRTNVQIVFRLA